MRLSSASILLFAVALTACGGGGGAGTQKATYGGTTYTKTGNTVTVENKEGKMTVTQGVNTADLGAPIYPGATQKQDAAGSITSKAGTILAASFVTPDGFDKVYAWYKAHLPKNAQQFSAASGPNGGTAEFSVGSNQKNATMVMLTTDENKQTQITITHTK